MPSRRRQFRVALAGEVRLQFHAAVDDLILGGRGDAGGDALVDHGLADGEDAVGGAGGPAFGEDEQAVAPPAFVGVERLAVDGMHHQWHAGAARRQPAQDAGLGGMGMDDVEALVAEEADQAAVGQGVLPWPHLADQVRDFGDGDARRRHAVEQASLGAGGWARWPG